MTPEAKIKLKALLLQHENYRQYPYYDSTGHLTVGIGRNLTSRGISQPEAIQLLDDDIVYFYNALWENLFFFPRLSETRQIVLVDMCFNLGVKGLLGFDKMIDHLSNADYENAAKEMLDSKWAMQVGDRAKNLANMLLRDE